MLGEAGDAGAQGFGRLIDAPLPATGGEPFGLVGRQGQATRDEEVLQCPGQRPHRPARAARAFQQRLWVLRLSVLQQTGELGHQPGGPAGVEPGRNMDGEVEQPVRRVRQAGDQVLRAGQRPVWLPLIARRAETKRGMPAQLAAFPADPRRLLRRLGT